ncbi:response regulator [Emticicia agri]|uniref:Response regulator n=1 Tax=Emticicia agri TaxID=2492393 RepID=A0A4Q5M4R7_9BACT|nr:response regulator [Emticicia agri]RYU97361.1 response regulator [Emticicia agri]
MKNLNILIIEDYIITATDLKEILEKHGHRVTAIAKNHGEAIRAIEREIPDLMLVDIILRNSAQDGIETAKDIVSNYSIPVIFLTANSESNTFERAKVLNPAAYLFKPFRNKELVFQIELAYNHYMLNKEDDNPTRSESIFLPHKKGHQRIKKSDVLCIKADRAYVWVFVKEEKNPFMFSMNLGYLAQFFSGNNFYQISRSYIVNLNFLHRFDSENIYLNHFNMGIPIPQNRRNELMKRLAIVRTPN